MPTSLSEPVIMTVSGFDPLGGARVIADLKTFGANGCWCRCHHRHRRARACQRTRPVYPVDVNILLQLNGTFEFDSAPGRGTTVKVEVPFRPAP
jgi:hypothetical protein